YWQQYFDGDPNVLGTLLEVAWDPLGSRPPGEPEPDSVQHRVVGVMAESASDIHFPGIAVWIPVEPAVALQLIRSMFGSRAPAELLSGLSARSYVRRDAGVSVQALLNELNTRYSGENSPIDRLRSGYSMDAIDGIVSSFAEYRDTRRQLELFLLSSLLLAFVAALNVSLFLLARAPGRRREFGIRLAVGAPMRRLVRQVATESCLFIVVAAILGLVMS